MRRVLQATILAMIVPLAACSEFVSSSSDAPETRPRSGAVATAEPHATEVGARVLEAGGNAVDAAVAVHFALAVTYPYAGNLGGGGFMLIASKDGRVEALDYRETAPRAAHETVYQDDLGNVDSDLSLNSLRAAGVPGSVLGMWEAHQRHGSLTWAELLAPAIKLADEGYVVDALGARLIREKAERIAEMRESVRERINFNEYFHARAGETLIQPELARTLRRIARDGPDDFYRGESAALIAKAMKPAGGWIDEVDLDEYETRWRVPVTGEYRGYRIVSMPPPSSGGVALIQMLDLFEHFETPPHHSKTHLHLVAEIEKRVFADRTKFMGDPDFFAVPVERLIAPEYLSLRAEEIHQAERSDPQSIAPGKDIALHESFETTHFSIVDENRMAVSCTTTLNAAFGSGIVVPGAGFLLNNEMDDFSAKPGVPNLYGVVGGEANKIEGGKRMLSSMTPTMVFDESGALRLLLGSPGGSMIFTTVFQVIVNHLTFGFNLEDAVRDPRFHHQWPPTDGEGDAIIVERTPKRKFPPELLQELEDMGYTIRFRDRIGNVQAIEIRGETVRAVADDRLGGAALSVP